MRFEDFILLQLLWYFAALRQSNQNKRQASSDLNKDMAFPRKGDTQATRRRPAILHKFGIRQAD
jgi:hypothetical protein